MPTIRWKGPGVFTDRQREFEARPGSEHDLDEEQADEYLNHDQFAHRFERVDGGDGSDGVETDDGSADEENTEENDSDATESDYETYPREELEEIEWADLRTLASESDHPDITGRSSRQDIVDALSED